MTEAMPFLQKYDITFLRPPTIQSAAFLTKEPSRSAKADRLGSFVCMGR